MVRPYVRNFITSQSLHNLKGLGFIVDVMVIDPTQEMVILNVISRPTCVVVKIGAIAKIYKYKRFHEGHHFISMAMEVQDAPGHNMDLVIKEWACLFHDK